MTGPQNQKFNYVWRSREHILYTYIFGNDRAYVSQWCASRMLPSGANFPNCSRRCQALAAFRRMAAILVDFCRRKDPQMWTALQQSNQRTRVFTRAAYSNYNEPGYVSRYSDSPTERTVRDRIPVGGDIFRTFSDVPWGPPGLLNNGYRVLPGVKMAGAWR